VKPLPAVALALTMMVGGVPASAAPTGSRQSWELSPFSWIKLKPAEKGAPANDHPLSVEAAVLTQALGTVRLASGSKVEPLFDPAEAADLGKVIAEAFAVAEPGQDLELLSTAKRGTGFFTQSVSVAARIFLQEGRLNLIVHDARLDVVFLYGIESRMPLIEYGSRTRPSPVVLRAAGAEARRPDWVVLPLVAGVPTTAATPATAAPLKVQPPSLPLPSPQPSSPPPTSLEDRLRSLKRLLEQDLISREDYEKKKQELLKGL
jgi:hypothetical protein